MDSFRADRRVCSEFVCLPSIARRNDGAQLPTEPAEPGTLGTYSSTLRPAWVGAIRAAELALASLPGGLGAFGGLRLRNQNGACTPHLQKSAACCAAIGRAERLAAERGALFDCLLGGARNLQIGTISQAPDCQIIRIRHVRRAAPLYSILKTAS